MPEITAKDTSRFAQALQQAVVAVGIAVEKGFITDSTAVEIIASIAAMMGVDIDAKAELEAAKEAAAAKREADAFTPPDNTPMPGDTPSGGAGA